MSGPPMDPHAIPIIKGYIAQTQGTILGAVTGALFLGLTLPILVALLYFSSAKSRKSFMWNLVVFAVTSGVAFALFATVALIKLTFDPFNIPQAIKYGEALAYIDILSAWIFDIPLLYRICIVYPYRNTPRLQWILIIGTGAALYIARLVAGLVRVYSVTSRKSVQTNLGQERIDHEPLVLAIYILYLLSNAYAAAIFLWKLRMGFQNGEGSGRHTDGSKDSLGARIRTLFWISTTNFVFPVIFNIVALALLPYADFATISLVLQANNHLGLIGVVFATVWNSTHRFRSERTPESSGIPVTPGQRSPRGQGQVSDLIFHRPKLASDADDYESDVVMAYPPSPAPGQFASRTDTSTPAISFGALDVGKTVLLERIDRLERELRRVRRSRSGQEEEKMSGVSYAV